MSEHTTSFISANETWALRQRVLRPGRESVDCQFPDDENPSSFHIGGFVDGKLVTVASVIKQKEERFVLFNSDAQFRLRGMATDESFQNQGLGTAVVSKCLEECRRLGGEILWCNARVTAVKFYVKMGFRLHEQPFDLPGVGIHHVMHAVLNEWRTK